MKDLKISKELLSEVLGYEVDTFLGINKNEIDYTCCKDENVGYIDTSLNIYEFAFKCKEWAFIQGFTIITEFVKQNGVFSYTVSNEQSLENYGYLVEGIKVLNYIPHSKTEHESIILACEWVLENKDNK